MSNKIKTILAALDGGNEKYANKLCNQILQKQPNNIQVKSFKALALSKLGMQEECLRLCNDILESSSIDASIISLIHMIYKEYFLFNEMRKMFEIAWMNYPEEEFYGKCFLIELMRCFDFSKAAQVAMKLYSKHKKKIYLRWIIIFIILSENNTMNDLAERLLVNIPLKKTKHIRAFNNFYADKYFDINCCLMNDRDLNLIKEASIENVEKSCITKEAFETPEDCQDLSLNATEIQNNYNSLLLHLAVYQSRNEPHKALELLNTFKFAIFSSEEFFALQTQFYIYSGNMLCAMAAAKRLFFEDLDNWSSFQLLIELHLLDNIDKNEKSLNEFFNSLNSRNGFLGMLELKRRLILIKHFDSLKNHISHEELCLEVKEDEGEEYINLIFKYIESYGHLSSCFNDLRFHLSTLNKNQERKVIELLCLKRKEISERNDTTNLFYQDKICLTLDRCLYALGYFRSLDDDCNCKQINDWVSKYINCIRKKIHSQYETYDGFLLMAADLLLHMDNLFMQNYYKNNRKNSSECFKMNCCRYVLEALCLLEYGVKNSKYNYELKLAIISVYNYLGSASTSYRWFCLLDLKNVQFETYSYIILTDLVRLAHWNEAIALCKNILDFRKDSEKQLVESIFNFGDTSCMKITELFTTLMLIRTSANQICASVELKFCELLSASDVKDMNSILTSMKILPQKECKDSFLDRSIFRKSLLSSVHSQQLALTLQDTLNDSKNLGISDKNENGASNKDASCAMQTSCITFLENSAVSFGDELYTLSLLDTETFVGSFSLFSFLYAARFHEYSSIYRIVREEGKNRFFPCSKNVSISHSSLPSSSCSESFQQHNSLPYSSAHTSSNSSIENFEIHSVCTALSTIPPATLLSKLSTSLLYVPFPISNYKSNSLSSFAMILSRHLAFLPTYIKLRLACLNILQAIVTQNSEQLKINFTFFEKQLLLHDLVVDNVLEELKVIEGGGKSTELKKEQIGFLKINKEFMHNSMSRNEQDKNIWTLVYLHFTVLLTLFNINSQYTNEKVRLLQEKLDLLRKCFQQAMNVVLSLCDLLERDEDDEKAKFFFFSYFSFVSSYINGPYFYSIFTLHTITEMTKKWRETKKGVKENEKFSEVQNVRNSLKAFSHFLQVSYQKIFKQLDMISSCLENSKIFSLAYGSAKSSLENQYSFNFYEEIGFEDSKKIAQKHITESYRSTANSLKTLIKNKLSWLKKF